MGTTRPSATIPAMIRLNAVRAPLATAVAGLSAIALLVGCSAPGKDAPSPSPSVFTVSGTMTVRAHINMSEPDDGDPCRADNGYDDIATGSQVEVQDAAGKTLALGVLDPGVRADKYFCRFAFTVNGVPDGGDIYGVAVGRESRGAVKFSAADIRQPVALTI